MSSAVCLLLLIDDQLHRCEDNDCTVKSLRLREVLEEREREGGGGVGVGVIYTESLP